MAESVMLETQLGDRRVRRGKVRDIYDLGNALLIVASDRISAFDVVLPTGIPSKGKVLTALSLFWFGYLHDVVPNHLISADASTYPGDLARADQLEGRSMLVRKAQVAPIECVVRGYLAGSGWQEYQKSQSVCGVTLPPDLRECDKLPKPIFTPTTKAETGHDLPLTESQVADRLGKDRTRWLSETSIRLYTKASERATTRGIIIADTKFEFGAIDGEWIVVDELLTPDSSRFWDATLYEPGRPQDSFDKQYVRDYLETLGWDKRPPAPALPPEVVERTAEKYREAWRRIVGGEPPR